MIINGPALVEAHPIKNMLDEKIKHANGLSYGLTEVGYDIRIAQDIQLDAYKSFVLASSMEEFEMPDFLMGVVHDKSTWAREGIAVQNSIIEPGWKGFLTLEVSFHGFKDNFISIKKGTPIAAIIFHEIMTPTQYSGKYQNQPDQPVGAKYVDDNNWPDRKGFS